MNKDTLYNHYLILLNAIKENSQLSITDLTKSTDLNNNSVSIFKEIRLLKMGKNKTRDFIFTYEMKEITKFELLKLIADKLGKRLIYVFDKENNLIDCHYKLKPLSDYYGITISFIGCDLKNKEVQRKEFYFSYDKDCNINDFNFRANPKVSIKRIKYDKDKVRLLKENKQVLLSSMSDIAKYFNTTLSSLSNWRKSQPEFNELMELRNYELKKIKVLSKLKESKNQQAIKHSSIIGYDRKWSEHKIAQYIAENNSPKVDIVLPRRLGVEGMKAKLKK